MAISRWCAALEPEIWEGTNGALYPMDQHRRCLMERWHEMNLADHGTAEERESWDCACHCHKEES